MMLKGAEVLFFCTRGEGEEQHVRVMCTQRYESTECKATHFSEGAVEQHEARNTVEKRMSAGVSNGATYVERCCT